MEKITIHFNLNGTPTTVKTEPNKRLLDVLRDDLHMVGTKEGCGVGECGACTVIVNRQVVTACLMLAGTVQGKDVVTIEGVGIDGKLDPIQEAILDNHATQCGFCTPGFVLSAKALLDENSEPTKDDIKKAISGNLCRCTGYEQLIDAIYDASKELKKQGKSTM